MSASMIEELVSRFRQVAAENPLRDVEKNLRVVAEGVFSKMNLVTREEFEIQRQVLLKTRKKLEALEAELARREASSVKP